MKLSDISNGPDWVLWVVIILFAALSVLFLSGRGSWLIAGYNTASKEEKAKYNTKKLCRVFGIGMTVITLLLVVTGLFENVLPAEFVYIAAGIILADTIIMIILGNTICKRRQDGKRHTER